MLSSWQLRTTITPSFKDTVGSEVKWSWSPDALESPSPTTVMSNNPCGKSLCLDTPLSPVQKPGTQDHRVVQALREVNKWIEIIPPISQLPISYSVCYHQDVRFTHYWTWRTHFPPSFLSKLSRSIFVCEWVDPEMGRSRQLTWIWLSQRFKNSPTIFDEALKEFSHFHSKYLSSQKLPYFNV